MPSPSSFDDPNPPFYPPREWLSESPARPPPPHPDSTPKASPSNPPQAHGDWRQVPTGATPRRSSRSASATGLVTPAVTHISYPKARLGIFHPTSAGGSIRDPSHYRYSTRTRNTNYSTPNDSQRHQNGHEASVDRNQLLSPVPPPPANLHTPQAAAAFSVDPGVPFLATAGPTEDGSDDGQQQDNGYGSNIPASMRPGPGPPRNLVDGLVSGIKNVVRKSTLRRRGEHPGGEVGEYEHPHDPNQDSDYDHVIFENGDAPQAGAGAERRESGYAPSTPQYDDAPAPTPAQPTPASLYAKQIQEQGRREEQALQEQRQQDQRERRRGPPPVSPIARDYVRGDHPSPHRINSQHGPSHSDGHLPAQATTTPRPQMIVSAHINEHSDDPEAIPFTYTPPGVPPQRGYSLHDPPVPSPSVRPSHLSRPATLPRDPPRARPRLNLLSPEHADTPPLPSPVSAAPHYAPDYAQMNLPTSAAALAALGFAGGYGAAGLRVYAQKVRKGWEAWRRLPWVVALDDESDEGEGEGNGGGRNAKEKDGFEAGRDEEEDWRQRVTWDYYPHSQRRIGRMGVKGGKRGIWKDDKGRRGGDGAKEDEWDEESKAVARRARVPAIVWRSAHYRVSLDDASMAFAHGHPGREGFQDGEGNWDEWHEGAWDSDAHGDPEAGSHYRGGGRGNESDPDGWMDIRPMHQPRRNVVITPQRRSHAEVDLADEFEAVTPAPAVVHTPLPLNPPGATPAPPAGAGPLPMYPPGQAPAAPAPSGPMPYYPPAPPTATGATPAQVVNGAPGNSPQPSRVRSVNATTPASVHIPPPIEPIDDEPPSARSRTFPPPLLPHPRRPQPQINTGVTSRGASVLSPLWSRPPPGQPPGTYAPMPPGFEDRASMRRQSTRSHGGQPYEPTLPSPARSNHSHGRAPSHRSATSHISAALRPPPGQPPETYAHLLGHEGDYRYPPPGAMQHAGSDAPSARSRVSQRSRPPPGQPPGTYPPFDDDEIHSHTHRREPAYGYTPSRASSNRSGLPPAPPPPGQPPGTIPPAAQAHLAYTPSHASRHSHTSRTSHASSNPFRPPPGQPPGTYPPFQEQFAAPHGDYAGSGVGHEEDLDDDDESYDHYTPTPAPRRAGTAGSGSAPSGGGQSSGRSHISTRAHRLLQTPGPASARSLAARELVEASDAEDEEDGDEDGDEHEGYVPYEGQHLPMYPPDEIGSEEIDWHDPGGPGYGEDSHLTFREALALQERRRQRPQ